MFILLIRILLTIALSPFSPDLNLNLYGHQATLMAVRLNQSLKTLSSPYDIARYINQHNDEADLDEIWDKYGISADGGKPGRCGCRGYDCPGTCKTEAINIGLGKGEVHYAILRICYAGGMDCWFLLFKKEERWLYVGVAESVDNKYDPVEYRVVNYGNDHWLVIKAGSGGTGFLAYDERWFHVSDQGLKEVLSYPVSGHSVEGDRDDYEIKSTVRNIRHSRGYSAVVEYRILKNHVDKPSFHWIETQEQKVSFDWDKRSKRFVFNKMESELQRSEANPIYNYLEERGYLK